MYLKILNTLFHDFLLKFCFLCSYFLEILSGMANSVDPDQTGLIFALFAYAILLATLVYKIFGHLPFIKLFH